jgi:release factor glutamine methyltransferase
MIIREIYKKYHNKIDSLDLELIIAHILGKNREFVLVRPEFKLAKNQELKTKNLLARRMRGEPLAYIFGQKEFYGLDFKVNKDVLVPRPETELLVELVLQELQTKNYEPRTLIDVGTGSGNIIVSLAKNLRTKNKFVAIDISTKALSIAKQNAKIHKVSSDIKFIKSDLLDYLLKYPSLIKNDCIFIANLPYLDTGWKNLLRSNDTKGLKFEPQIALYAGIDGLDAYRKLANQLELLKKIVRYNFAVFCEIGHTQKKEIERIFSFAKKIEFKKDLAGKWRVCKISL